MLWVKTLYVSFRKVNNQSWYRCSSEREFYTYNFVARIWLQRVVLNPLFCCAYRSKCSIPSNIQYFLSQNRQLLGRMLRQCISTIGLKEMGRTGGSFDMHDDSLYRVNAGGYSLEIAPGYLTSIRRYESDVLLNISTLHKVIRKEKAMDIMNRILNSPKIPKSEVREKVNESFHYTFDVCYWRDCIDIQKNSYVCENLVLY